MSLLLLPVNPVDPLTASESMSLVPAAPRSMEQASQIPFAPSADVSDPSFPARSSSTRRSEPEFIEGTPVEESEGDENESARSAWEYVSGWAWSRFAENSAIAQYLSYATAPVHWSGMLINLYA